MKLFAVCSLDRRPMETVEIFERLSVALAIGLLIGIERGWQEREDPEGHRSAGVRTHALAGLLGGTWGAVALQGGAAGFVALGLAFLVFGAVITLFRYRETVAAGTFGATTVIAALTAFSLGAYAVVGNMHVAAGMGVVATGFLALKSLLHAWIRNLTWLELRSGLLLLAMTFVALPLLPDRAIDPWGAVNPYHVWLVTILIALISFIGYAAIRIAGARRGILITGIAGGLVSSTAVTLTLSRLAREHPEQQTLLMAGSILSAATMMGRVLAVATVLNRELLAPLAMVLIPACLVLLAIGLIQAGISTRHNGVDGRLQLINPFDPLTVLQFAGLLLVILLASKIAVVWTGSAGVYFVAAVSSVMDVDAITLSMAGLAQRSELDPATAISAILVAVAGNTVAKTVLAYVTGGAGPGIAYAWAAGLSFLAGASGFALLRLSPVSPWPSASGLL